MNDSHQIKILSKICHIFDEIFKFERFLERDIEVLVNDINIKDYKRPKKYAHFNNFSYPQSMTMLKLIEQATNVILHSTNIRECQMRMSFLRMIESFVEEKER